MCPLCACVCVYKLYNLCHIRPGGATHVSSSSYDTHMYPPLHMYNLCHFRPGDASAKNCESASVDVCHMRRRIHVCVI